MCAGDSLAISVALESTCSKATLREVEDISRGPGRWQRVILDALAQHTDYDIFGVYALVEEHLQRTPTRSELVAARRAVKTLAIAGKIRAIYHPHPTIDGREAPELTVIRPDADIYIPRGRAAKADWITSRGDRKTERERRQQYEQQGPQIPTQMPTPTREQLRARYEQWQAFLNDRIRGNRYQPKRQT
jgi:hypothetical protein